jgi:hypothetical protein
LFTLLFIFIYVNDFFKLCNTRTIKGKAPVVPFHGITSLYNYFEEIWIFALIQLATEKTEKQIMFCFRTEHNQQCFGFQNQMLTTKKL